MIAGIIIGFAAGVAVSVGATWWAKRRRRIQEQNEIIIPHDWGNDE